MHIAAMRGTIARRILINYRIDPEVLRRLLPAPFRPQLVGMHGMAGICLIRLTHLRPRGLPAALGLWSENAAHRIAVEWEGPHGREVGVYIPRRDTSSRLNVLAGGRLFPGEHHHARFTVRESGDAFRVAVDADDDGMHVAIEARIARMFPPGSIFGSLEAASAFFERGSVGYSATARADRLLDGVRLEVARWKVEPLAVERVESSFFRDARLFPPGSAEFDCALLMRDVRHVWHGCEPLRPERAA